MAQEAIVIAHVSYFFSRLVIAMAAVDRFYLLYREISRSCSFYIEALAIVGAWYTVRKCVSLAFDTYSMLRLHLIPKLGGEIDLVKRYGKWAVVTGKRLKQICWCLCNYCAGTVKLAGLYCRVSFMSQAGVCVISGCKFICLSSDGCSVPC